MKKVLSPRLMRPRKLGKHFLCPHHRRTEIQSERLLLLLLLRLLFVMRRHLLSLKLHVLIPTKEAPLPEGPAVGIVTKIEAKYGVSQTPPLMSRLNDIQSHLENTGIEACPKHQMDHGVRDLNCDYAREPQRLSATTRLRAIDTYQSSLLTFQDHTLTV